MPKFQTSVSVYRVAKLPPHQAAPCYPEIFKINLCLVVLRQLPPSQPAPCYSKITTRAKPPTSCEIPTCEMPVIPLNRKNRLKSVGYFHNLPHISDKRVPKPWFPTPIPSAHPFVHRGRENPRSPTPSSIRHPAGASSLTTSSTATPRRPSSTVPDEDPSSIWSSRRFSHPVLHLQGAAPTFPLSFAPPPFPHHRLHLHHRKCISITISSDEAAA